MVSAFQVMFAPGLHDLNPILAGEGASSPGIQQRLSPAQDCVVIHYILRGKGFVCVNGRDYPVRAGQAFLLRTSANAYYVADPTDPWFFRWVGFSGELSHQFDTLPPVLDLSEDPFPSLQHLQDPSKPLDYLLAGDLFHLYCKVLTPKNKKLDHIQQIMMYIQKHFAEAISVEDLARQYGLDRRYLSRQFKKRTGYTIRSYITEVRLDSARHFLRQGYSGKEVAILCGFSDTSNFYKVFKETQGMNPSDWKKDQEAKTASYSNRPE